LAADPRGLLAPLVLAGWSALALTPARRPADFIEPGSPANGVRPSRTGLLAAGALTTVVGLTLSGLLFLPMLGKSDSTGRLAKRGDRGARYQDRLLWPRRLNPLIRPSR